MEEIIKILREVGLVENESQVYVTLLKIGSSPVSTIAAHSGLYRPYVYDTLKRLSEKGLASFVLKDNKKFYKASDPLSLKEILGEKERALDSILPKLLSFTNLPKNDSKIELFSGRRVVRVVQKDVLKILLKHGGESLVIGVDEKRFMETDPIIMKQFFNQLKKNNLKERVLVRDGDNYLPAHKKTTEYRFIPKDFFNPTSTFIYGGKVAIIIFTEPLCGIIIDNKDLSDTYRKQFDLLWRGARKAKSIK